jgi:hypothetical protein
MQFNYIIGMAFYSIIIHYAFHTQQDFPYSKEIRLKRITISLITRQPFLYWHLLHTVSFFPSFITSSYNSLMRCVLHTGQVPLPLESSLIRVFPRCDFVDMFIVPSHRIFNVAIFGIMSFIILYILFQYDEKNDSMSIIIESLLVCPHFPRQ